MEQDVVQCAWLHTNAHRLLGWALSLAAICSIGCGAADTTRAVQDEPPDGPSIQGTINSCPSFQFSLVLPQAIRAGETANVVAFATDPDSGGVPLRYAWAATSGKFDAPDDSYSRYTCSDAGPQVLSVTASDLYGCENSLDFDIECDVP